MTRPVFWLHLSDFHMRADKTWDQNQVLTSLLDDIKKIRDEKGLDFDFCLITGDLAWSGKPKEYELVAGFLDRLRSKDVAGLRKEKILVVPGNHDINRTVIKRYHTLPDPDQDDVLSEFFDLKEEGPQWRRSVFAKFRNYAKFTKEYFGGRQSFSHNASFFEKRIEKRVKVVGLCSVWLSANDQDRNRLALGEQQVSKALEKVDEGDLVIAAMHHPIAWLSDADQARVKPLLRKRCHLICHGHIHQTSIEFSADPAASAWTLSAGASFEKRESLKNAYCAAKYDPFSEDLTLYLRMYNNKSGGFWVPDVMNYRDVEGEVTVNIKTGKIKGEAKRRGRKPCSKRQAPLPVISDEYKNWVRRSYKNLDIEGLLASGQIVVVPMKPVYIDLYTQGDQKERPVGKGRAKEAEELIEEKKAEKVELAQVAGKNKLTLITGMPGSGKTTFLRRLAVKMADDEAPATELAGLPTFFVPLEDLCASFPRGKPRGADFLEKALQKTIVKYQCGIDEPWIKDHMKRGQTVILLDGMDEIPARERQRCVEAIRLFVNKAGNPHKVVVTARPYAVDEKVLGGWDVRPTEILGLGREQVEGFVTRWFTQVEGEIKGQGAIRGMLADLEGHPRVGIFTSTPLLLTAVCLLYSAQRRLPHNRAELYERVIEHIVSRRFRGAQGPLTEFTVMKVLMALAHHLHVNGKRSVGVVGASEILRSCIKKKVKHDEARILLEEVLQKTGLIRNNEQGEIQFGHLTFQEFLVARWIATTTRYYYDAIKEYLDQSDTLGWWKEGVELLCGYHGINSSEIACELIGEIFDHVSADPVVATRTRILAGEALSDLDEDKRDDQLEERIKGAMLQIVDDPEQSTPLPERTEAGTVLGRLGDPRIREIDMIEIPDGRFWMGAQKEDHEGNNYDEEARDWESPVKQRVVKTFKLSKYPITNSQYERFVFAGGYSDSGILDSCWTKAGRAWREKEGVLLPALWYDSNYNIPNQPVVGVSWYEAVAFCNWLSRVAGKPFRLPTEIEWEYAARGGRVGEPYPWSKEWDPERANHRASKPQGLKPVGLFPKGANDFDLLDMSGNTDEWCSTKWREDRGEEKDDDLTGKSPRIVRGGAWFINPRWLRVSNRGRFNPDVRDYDVGFRCAQDCK